MQLIFVLLGPQGAGKGTQAEYLTDHFGIPALSVGQMFREEIAIGSDLGNKVKSFVDNGKLVPQDITNKVTANALKLPQYKAGIILDGYPRDLIQAEALAGIATVSALIDIEISDAEAINRLSQRLVCKTCGRSYNLVTRAPVVAGICDKDGGALERRKDDTPEAIRDRLQTYHSVTEPIVDYYRKQGTVALVNGEQPIVEVHESIVDGLKKLGIEKQK
jgi:adenylate kinase